MTNDFRPPATPLITVDPFFNVWSNTDKLNEGNTVHWTHEKDTDKGIHEMIGLIRIDNEVWQFMGKNISVNDESLSEHKNMKQVKLDVRPFFTTYEFQGGGITLKVEFMTPLLLDDLDILSQPVSYIDFEVSTNDNQNKNIQIYFDITSELVVSEKKQEVEWSRNKIQNDIDNLSIGTVDQNVLGTKGDDHRIDWGYLHLVVPNAKKEKTLIHGKDIREQWINKGTLPRYDDTNKPRSVIDNTPVLAVVLNFDTVGSEKKSKYIALAYNDINSIQYFNKNLPAYWKRNGKKFDVMLQESIKNYSNIKEKCYKTENNILNKADEVGGEKYKDIVSIAYRQAISAHKLVKDNNGDLLFFSKENNSNGCIGTVDISYPSMPIFLLYNPELIKGMLRPIFTFARSGEWEFDFAPHDVGTYPIANGQVYGDNLLENQMPIEESGNMLIMTTALCLAEGDTEFVKSNWDLLTKWADYLMENGFDPKNQLSTDDFSGHLAHNTNLSIKAIIGIASYSKLCKLIGKEKDSIKYYQLAKEWAEKWEVLSLEDTHYKLAFDQSNTWSLKYNLIWDELFSLDLFSDNVQKMEVDHYLSKMNYYGVPLDSRETYTKADWLVWIAALSNDDDKTKKIIKSLWNFLNETDDRVPFTDWYDTVTGKRVNFKNRSVVGGVFILILKKTNWTKY